MTGPQHSDGRVARGVRTREAIVDAHSALLREGDLRPTGKSVASRAGVSLRTLWLNFKDIESLLEATGRYWLEHDAASWTPVPATLPLADRIDRFCVQRAARMEGLAPAARSGLTSEPFSPALRAARLQHLERLHADLVATFGAELGTARDSVAHRLLFALANSMTWQLLRDDEGLSVEQATEVVRLGFRLVLERPGVW
ncbi:TetR/AcrR family transcriptional regulator [Aeromicrobium chenweiae]|uniref:TetR family transcriptional regulator n=1 Tax=Aeromicrobium chenweiae TaxID=2079793 RepID=A0A2S0WRJ8_9ACTN|nr:TetR/AcrR family transcriptional regulator [Aeromicrobium chenweiae]AWB93941.1 TetR family transcriptional regulator [Aeromicrobium chenweiae]TGN30988.1 TetR/AcrR family transcriptional regulator [Aeromicrobium chenweiae]